MAARPATVRIDPIVASEANVKRVPVTRIDAKALERWPTRRLLGRLASLRRLEPSPATSDMTEAEALAWRRLGIGFKCDDDWAVARRELGDILDRREHVVRPGAAASSAAARRAAGPMSPSRGAPSRWARRSGGKRR